MAEQQGLSDQYRKASAWPLFIALGLAIAEVGVVIDIVPITVGGLLLLVGSLAGILTESDYLATPWPFVGALGLVLAVAGIALSIRYPVGGDSAINIGFRAISIAVAGVVCMGGSLLGRVVLDERSTL